MAIEDQRRWGEIESAIGRIEGSGHEWDADPAAWVRAEREAVRQPEAQTDPLTRVGVRRRPPTVHYERVPTVDEIRALEGAEVTVRLVPEAGGEVVEGRLVGTLDAADGLVVVVQPKGAPDRRFSCNYQHVASIERS